MIDQHRYTCLQLILIPLGQKFHVHLQHIELQDHSGGVTPQQAAQVWNSPPVIAVHKLLDVGASLQGETTMTLPWIKDFCSAAGILMGSMHWTGKGAVVQQEAIAERHLYSAA